MNGTSRASKSIHQVMIINDDEEAVEVNERSQMNQELLKAYEVTLNQSNLTPCTILPLKEKFGSCGNGALAAELLSENLQYMDSVDTPTLEVVWYLTLKEGKKFCHRPAPLLINECQTGWMKTKEKISSAMAAGTHFGQLKAVFGLRCCCYTYMLC